MDVLSYLLSKKYTDTVISQIANFETYILEALPETGECHIFYIIPGDNNETHDLYIWAANKGTFEKVGSTKVDLTNYYNKEEIKDLLKNLDVDFTGYATEEFVRDAITNIKLPEAYNDTELRNLISEKADKVHSHDEYLTEHQSLEGYAKETYVDTAINNIVFPKPDLNNYYTKSEVENLIPDTSKFITEIPEDYATKAFVSEEITKAVTSGEVTLEGYATETYVQTEIANLNIPSIEGLTTEKYVDDAIAAISKPVEEVKTTLSTAILPKVEKVDEILPVVEELKTTAATQEWVNEQNFATEQFVTDTLANINVSTECTIGLDFTTNIKLGHLKAGTEIKSNMTLGEILRKILVCDHEYGDWVITKQPEVGVPGEQQKTCKCCGEVATEAIPALPEPEEPVGITYLAGTFGNDDVEVQEWPSYIDTWSEEEQEEISMHYVNNMIEYSVASEEDLVGRHGFAIKTPFVIESQSLAEYGDSSTDPYITRPAIVLPKGYEVTAWNTDIDNSSLSECAVLSYELTDGRIVYYTLDFQQQTGTTVTHYLTIVKN